MLVKDLRNARGTTQFLFYYVESLVNRLDAEIELKISVYSICLAWSKEILALPLRRDQGLRLPDRELFVNV